MVALQRSQQRWLAYRESEQRFIEQRWTQDRFGTSASLSASGHRTPWTKARVIGLWRYAADASRGACARPASLCRRASGPRSALRRRCPLARPPWCCAASCRPCPRVAARSDWVTPHRLERISFQLASDAGDLRPDGERIERGSAC